MPDRKFRKHKKTPVLGRLLICNSKLVRERVFRWNPLCNNLMRLGKLLTELGLLYTNGNVAHLQGGKDEL
jgi:hypothetical protein